MSLTLAQLWGEVAANLGGPYADGTAASGSTSTIVDTTNLPAIGADDYLNNGFVCVITDAGGAHAAPEGETRVISDFVRSTGVITVASNFTAAVAVGDTYRVWTGLPRAALVDAVKAALRSAWPAFRADVVDDTTTIVTSDYEYTVPSTITHLTDVQMQGDSAATHYVRVHDWKVRETGATRTLVLENRHDYSVGYILRCIGTGPLSAPATDYATLTIAPEWEQPLLEYVGFYGAMICHQRMLARDRDNRDYHMTAMNELKAAAKTARAKGMPKPVLHSKVEYPRYWADEE